jgi:hypothetical protein
MLPISHHNIYRAWVARATRLNHANAWPINAFTRGDAHDFTFAGGIAMLLIPHFYLATATSINAARPN